VSTPGRIPVRGEHHQIDRVRDRFRVGFPQFLDLLLLRRALPLYDHGQWRLMFRSRALLNVKHRQTVTEVADCVWSFWKFLVLMRLATGPVARMVHADFSAMMYIAFQF